jgi:hypothetical protein
LDELDVGGTAPRHVPVVLLGLPATPSRVVGLLSMSLLERILVSFDFTPSAPTTISSKQIQASL